MINFKRGLSRLVKSISVSSMIRIRNLVSDAIIANPDMQNKPQKGTRLRGIAENADLDILYALLRQEGFVSSYTKSMGYQKRDISERRSSVHLE